MDKLASWPKGIARVLIAGLLAWAVVMQGLSAAASARGDIGVVPAEAVHCAADGAGDGRGHAPGRHLDCSCCIPCRAGQIGGLSGFPPVASISASLSSPIADVVRADLLQVVGAASPPGWTSSWSQRAPPRFVSAVPPPRA